MKDSTGSFQQCLATNHAILDMAAKLNGALCYFQVFKACTNQSKTKPKVGDKYEVCLHTDGFVRNTSRVCNTGTNF